MYLFINFFLASESVNGKNNISNKPIPLIKITSPNDIDQPVNNQDGLKGKHEGKYEYLNYIIKIDLFCLAFENENKQIDNYLIR